MKTKNKDGVGEEYISTDINEDRKIWNLKCLICRVRNGIADTKRAWEGPSCTEFAQDLSFTDSCRLKGGKFLKYNADSFEWDQIEELSCAANTIFQHINTSNCLFVCNDCIKKPAYKNILREMEINILEKILKSQEESMAWTKDSINTKQQELLKIEQKKEKIKTRLLSLK